MTILFSLSPRRRTVKAQQRQIINRLAHLLPPAPESVTINFDLTISDPKQFAEVEKQIALHGGFTVALDRFGPGGGWPSWTVTFYQRASATAFLKKLGLLAQGECLDDYVERSERVNTK